MTHRTFLLIAWGVCVALFPILQLWAEEQSEAASTPAEVSQEEPLSLEAQRVADELSASLPADSEARAMLDHILDGSRLGPTEGWFAKSHAQSRYGWDFVKQTYDADADDRIAADEFTGTADDFRRLDRNADGVVTAADFDWSDHSLARTPGFMLFFQTDRDANGKISREEFTGLFDSLDTDAQGFIALDDVRDQFQPPGEQQQQQERAERTDRPSRSTLVLGLKRQEIGSLNPGPNLNEVAPDFTLKSLEGRDVTLSEEIGDQPVVLVFGNFTCGPFRSQSGNIEKLAERYRGRAKFFLVYVREAHPNDGWWMTSNERVGIDVPQPQDNEGRRKVAQTCREHLDLEILFLVDSVDDKVGATYSGMPNRLYLIDGEGKIAFKNARGPFGFHPRQLEQALVLLLNDQETSLSE